MNLFDQPCLADLKMGKLKMGKLKMMLTRTGKTLFACRSIRRYLRDSQGLAAIEFAILAPMLGMLYMGAVDAGDIMTLDRKVTAIASATADLVAQEKEMNQDKIGDIYKASAQMVVPYDSTPVSITVTCVISDLDTGETTVKWSNSKAGDALAIGSAITIPEGLIANGETVILTEVTYSYPTVLGYLFPRGITLEDQFYLKPRRTKTIEWL